MNRFAVVFCFAVCLANPGSPAFAQTRGVNPRSVIRSFDTIKPADSEFRWKKIPWMTDLEKAMATAAKEKRPLFLWGSDDNPLDRC